jgi:hypothetical protein
MRQYFLRIVLLIGPIVLWAQNVTITDVSLQGADVIITYDLDDPNIDHKYVLNLYSSQDEFVQPLTEVEGDIGIDLSVGGNKRVIWHARDELGGNFDGRISLEIKGRLYIPFVTLNDFDKYDKLKRDRPYTITWAAGRGSNVLKWDLYNNRDQLIHTFTNIANVGEYELVVPKDIKPGKDYYMMISDQNNKEDVVRTPTFSVTRKVPLYVNMALIALGVTTSYLVIDAMSGGGEPSDELEELPAPELPF